MHLPVVYWLPGGGCNEEADSPSVAHGWVEAMGAAIRTGKLPPLIFVFVNGGRFTRYHDFRATLRGRPFRSAAGQVY